MDILELPRSVGARHRPDLDFAASGWFSPAGSQSATIWTEAESVDAIHQRRVFSLCPYDPLQRPSGIQVPNDSSGISGHADKRSSSGKNHTLNDTGVSFEC